VGIHSLVLLFHADELHHDIHGFQADVVGKIGADSERNSDFAGAVIGDFLYFFQIQSVGKNDILI